MVHKVTAVGSRSVAKAQKFINDFVNGDKTVKAYGTYDEVYADKVRESLSSSLFCLLTSFKNVDAIYIGMTYPGHDHKQN